MKKDWEIKKLGELCKFIGDGDWIESGDQSTEGIRLVQTGNIGNGIYLDKEDRAHYISEETFKRLRCTEIFSGDCLISRLPDPVGRACIIPDLNQKMITAVDCTIIRFKETIQTQYFVYYSQSNKYLSDIDSEATGATRKRISRKNLEKINIPVPPLEEQKRIVKILDEKFAQLETIKTNAQTNLQNAKDLFQSQLTKAFSNTTWEKKRLGDVFYVKSGGTPSRSKKEYWNGDIPWYSSGELGNRYTTNSERNINSLAIDNSNAKLFPKGSLLIGMYDTAAMKMSILDRDATFNQAIAGVKPSEEHNLQFIRLYLDSIKTEMFELRRGTRQKNLSLEKIKEIKIPLTPLPEQKRIVKELDTLSEKVRLLQEIYKKQIANCDELKQSLLQKAFAGEL